MDLSKLYYDCIGEELSPRHVDDFGRCLETMFNRKDRPRYYKALSLRYSGNTLKFIGEELGIGKERVRQIICKAIKMIQHRLMHGGWDR